MNMKKYCKPTIEVLVIKASTILAGSNPPAEIQDPTIPTIGGGNAREIFGISPLEPNVESTLVPDIDILGM